MMHSITSKSTLLMLLAIARMSSYAKGIGRITLFPWPCGDDLWLRPKSTQRCWDQTMNLAACYLSFLYPAGISAERSCLVGKINKCGPTRQATCYQNSSEDPLRCLPLKANG